jgi:acetoin utilization protein AcuC
LTLVNEKPIYNIRSINQLPPEEKREIYCRLIPTQILERYQIELPSLYHGFSGQLKLKSLPDSGSIEMELRHIPEFPDPVLYGHLTDTLTDHIHILLYILNDPDSPRFDVDKMPDGTRTKFGTSARNLDEEKRALDYGLAPGQVRRGLRLLGEAILAFERFIASLGQELYFAEPLYYHTAVLFERYGFAYEKGRRLMERIQSGFAPGGELLALLDGSTPFRSASAANSIRLRSWAIHDNLLGEPFTNVTMYKRVDKLAGLNTCKNCSW